MKQIVSLIVLCLAPHLWAQTPFENIIQILSRVMQLK